MLWMRQTWILVGMAAFGVVGIAATAGAQEASESGGVVLHEYFDPGSVAIDDVAAPSGIDSQPTATAPSAGEPPGLTLDPGGGDVILGPKGPVDDDAKNPPYGPRSPRSGHTKLDDMTSRVDSLNYYSAFSPSVFPYKRNVVQNRVVRTEGAGDYQMRTASGEMTRIPVSSGTAAEDEDTFWGTFLVRADEGRLHPIPSVAPTQRFLRLRTEPDVEAELYRDEADNYYVRIDSDGLIRINALVAAPRFYFDGSFRGEVEWSAFRDVETPPFDEDIRPAAKRVVADIGLSPEMSPDVILDRLIYHFRDFETKELPERYKKGDLYEAISKQQIGVCRHRSLAFVVTAQSLGIPARYVTNEAHAFVEVYWPNGGWRRVDLGGAAQEISYNGDSDDALHDASGKDSFPKPPNYLEELRKMRGESDSEGRSREGDSEASSSDSAGRRSERKREGSSSEEIPEGDPSASSDEEAPMAEAFGSDGETERVEDERTDREKAATTLSLRTSSRTVFRGSNITVYGALREASGSPISEETIFVYFGRVGATETAQMKRIGKAKTDGTGRYHVKVTIPETTGIGRWSMIAVFPGNDTYRRVRAE